MPLFIDLHIDRSFTPEIVEKAHVADKTIQEKYGVRYLQVLLNEPEGHLFCLVEGPDKETCAKVHRLAHGNIACNILEITEGIFNGLLADKKKDSRDFTRNQDGTLDTGTRAILAFDILGSPENVDQGREMIKEALRQSGSKGGDILGDQTLVFDSCMTAVNMGVNVRKKFIESKIPVELRMGIDIGLPLSEKGSFFESVRRSAVYLAFIAEPAQIVVTSRAIQLYGDSDVRNITKAITHADWRLLNHVLDGLNKIWNDGNVTISDFAHELGLSKSQLTRKLKLLTSLSPNDLIKEFRLRKSIRLMEDKSMNVAEISMAIGFNNAAYFAKCFRDRFGIVPSHFSDAT